MGDENQNGEKIRDEADELENFEEEMDEDYDDDEDEEFESDDSNSNDK